VLSVKRGSGARLSRVSRTMPRVLVVDPAHPDPSAVAEAAAVLVRGGLVAFPTETVYGLGARGLHADEVARIFVAKGRPSTHPLILHVSGVAMAAGLAASWPARAEALARRFWPGPLTIVVPRAAHVPDAVTGGLGSVGLRSPAHPVALALLAAVGEPLAGPSANAHTHVSPTTASHVIGSLGDAVDLVLDAGACAHGIESTVVDVTGEVPRVLRPGAVSLEALRAVDPDVVYEGILVASGDFAARASPGMAAKHYAPRTRVVLADGAAGVSGALARALAQGSRTVAAITWSDASRDVVQAFASAHPGCVARAIALPPSATPYAAGMFAALHEVDGAGVDQLVVENVPHDASWWAVRDRLARAARA
jgi:L-threonylcarbamoyladenylate synthase